MHHLGHFSRRLVDELQPVMPDTARDHPVEVAAGDLCFRSKNRIPAADIRHDRMRAALLSRSATCAVRKDARSRVARPVRQEAAEDAVFGMEHRQMLIGDHLEALAAHALRQLGRSGRRSGRASA